MYVFIKISELKEELSSIKSSSAVLGDQQPRDIVRKSVAMLSVPRDGFTFRQRVQWRPSGPFQMKTPQ